VRLHPHLHGVVAGGGLDVEGNRWVATPQRFLFPVKALAKRFRGKLLDGLRSLRVAGALCFDGPCRRTGRRALPHRLVVYAKPSLGDL